MSQLQASWLDLELLQRTVVSLSHSAAAPPPHPSAPSLTTHTQQRQTFVPDEACGDRLVKRGSFARYVTPVPLRQTGLYCLTLPSAWDGTQVPHA